MRRSGLLVHAAGLVFFAALAVVHTWPLATAPHVLSRNDNGDTLLNEWTLAWVAHQAPRDPLHLFDANIFHPEPRTLLFSEHLLPQSVIASPVLWAGGSPVLAHNLALLAGFTLTGWAMAFVVRRWTGSWPAGLVAGSLAAFNAHSLTRLAHLQAQHLEFLPLAILALDRLFESPRIRHALSLAGWFALQALASGYFLVFTAAAMVVSAAVRPRDWTGGRFRRTAPYLALAGGVALVALLPVLVPYWQVRQDHGLVRTLKEIAVFSAKPGDYLATGSLIHWPWSRHFWQGNGLFPGVAALALGALALGSGVALRDPRARMWLAIAVACFCLSFGTRLPLYAPMFHVLPLLQGIRNVLRFGQIALVALAAVAGFGAAWWLARTTAGPRRVMLAVLLVTVVNAEAWRGPLGYVRFDGIPRIFRSLAAVQNALVVYFPMYWFSGEFGRNAEYMLASTTNWQPMLNGYSGFMPASYWQHLDKLDRFPDAASIRYLRQVGVTYVVVDTRFFGAERSEAVGQVDALRLWTADDRYHIYQVQ